MTATTDDTAHDLVSGQVVAGRYQIDRPLGEGGMGVVYLANDRSLGSERRVALKILARRFLGKPARERRFANEARFAGRLPTHTNLATTLDAGRIEDGRPYIAMEYVDGPAINGLRVVTGRTIPPVELCRMARGVADALRVVHQSGLVHRDLTPTNVLVTTIGGEWVPKLIDFSHAAAVDGPRLELGHPGRLTQPHETPGTPGYMPPEQVGNAYPSPPMDVFAFGVVLWELLAERHAYRQRDRADYFAKQKEQPQAPPPLVEHRKGLPPALYQLVADCTNVEPTTRPKAEEVVERLESVILGLTHTERIGEERSTSGRTRAAAPVPLSIAVGSRSFVRSEQEEEPEGQPTRPWLVASVLLVLGLVAGVTMWLLLEGEDPREGPNENVPAVDPTDTKSYRTPTAHVADEPPPAVATTGPETDARATSPDEQLDEAETVAVPEPQDTEPTPIADAQPTRRAGAAVRESAECIALRTAADEARERLDWSSVLSLTKQSRCWPTKTRARLRVRASLNLGHYDQCVREHGNSRDPAVMAAVKACKESLDP